jgi:carboxypeptidase Q
MQICRLFSFIFVAIAVVSLEATVEDLHSQDFVQDVLSHADDAAKIIHAATSNPWMGTTYQRLAQMVDTFGPRIVGSTNLENAIDFIVSALNADGLDNVHTEPVKVPHWIRGHEYAELILPRHKTLAILGLGTSVGTPPQGITAEALVVTSFADLHQKGSLAKGKIVVFNQEWVSYEVSVAYRTNGASEASKYGAVAALIRSITPFSLYTPHTGVQHYAANVTRIPAACITVEDAELLYRMQQRDESLVIHLKMEARSYPEVTSRNIVADLRGTTFPDEVVLVSGHIDSWDVGQGAMDDGGGAFVAWNALSLLHHLGLRAKRTIRLVMWTGEEFGAYGGQAFWDKHKEDMLKNYVLVEESDMGTFRPRAIGFTGTPNATRVMQEVVKLLVSVNASTLDSGAQCPDLGGPIAAGIPAASLNTINDKYFYFHHTNADTMTVLNSAELDLCTAVTAVVAYVVADLKDKLPR